MRCAHEFFKPGSLTCARCGEPMRSPARHVRVGAPGTVVERFVLERAPVRTRARRATGASARHTRIDLFDIAFSEMSAAAQGLAGLGVRR